MSKLQPGQSPVHVLSAYRVDPINGALAWPRLRLARVAIKAASFFRDHDKGIEATAPPHPPDIALNGRRQDQKSDKLACYSI